MPYPELFWCAAVYVLERLVEGRQGSVTNIHAYIENGNFRFQQFFLRISYPVMIEEVAEIIIFQMAVNN